MRAVQIDPVIGGPVRTVRGAHIARVLPSPLKNPSLIAVSDDALQLIEVQPEDLSDMDPEEVRMCEAR